MSPKDYQQKVNHMQDHRNRSYYVLGAIMMTLFVASLFLFPPLIAGAATAGLCLSAMITCAVTTTSTAAAGITFFEKGQRRGLSKAAFNLRQTATTLKFQEHNENTTPTVSCV